MKCHDGNSKEMVDKLYQKEMLSNEMLEAGFVYLEPPKEAPIEDFSGRWHRQVTKEHICIWSDEWMEKHLKQLEREKNDPTPNDS